MDINNRPQLQSVCSRIRLPVGCEPDRQFRFRSLLDYLSRLTLWLKLIGMKKGLL
jgi:hypothetical protein